MRSAITRLALIQIVAIFYTILVTGVALKLNYNNLDTPFLATGLRDYGFLLIVLPVVWLVWASIHDNRAVVGTGDARSILGSGLGLLGFLVLLAFFGTVSACSHHLMVQSP